ncbi:MAG: tRNA 2-thiouridine(34) synthase MnmA [Eubacteriales bacterium]
MKKAIIAMSGGVDSSVAALLTVEQGFSCIGATMKLFSNEDIGEKREKSCCSLDDVEDARSVADSLGMPHYVFNFAGRFRETVIDRFVSDYENGRTPNPCIDCNRYLKFDKLFCRMKELDFDYIVTGHYARIERDGERFLLKKALDETKDQSYVLYSMTQEQLAHTMFPLGALTKTRVREIAAEHGFVNAKKHDSQDICFVRNGTYADFIRQYTGREYPAGDFLDVDGNILGRHRGIIHYTVGQHKGLGISSAVPLYVKEIRPQDNTVVLCGERELYSKTLRAERINLIAGERLERPMRLTARVRYRQKEQSATAVRTGEDELRVEFDEPQRAVTKGQAVVLYDGDIVVGGGTIC